MGAIKTRLLSSLEKVFLEDDCPNEETDAGMMLSNEIFSFQLAFTAEGGNKISSAVKVDSPLGGAVTPYAVGYVPSELPAYCDHDGDYLKTKPGLFPDALLPCGGTVDVMPCQWRSLWFIVDTGGKAPAGSYPIRVTLEDEAGEVKAQAEFRLEILSACLPEQQLIYTDWFHADCLSTQYGVPVFSERYWQLMEAYLSAAAKYGMNMVLTPVFTPPLDTAVGAERPTVQLADVTVTGEGYSFGFDRLKRWIATAQKCGIRYFEISHLFTQWGAKAAPKIMANKDGRLQRIFGWETDAGSEEYRRFLSLFLTELRGFLQEEKVLQNCFFHISDEPSPEILENYRQAMETVSAALPGCTIIDALSSYDFYEKGVVKHPIPASNHIGAFLNHKVPHLWTYYCCSQGVGVCNRFMAMPSSRNRALGLQLFKFDIEGFLHWGYNFWYSRLSAYPIDPYRVTDGALTFPSGDAFCVYPGENGPVLSLRMVVFNEGLQDLRALKLLEALTSKAGALGLAEQDGEQPLSFDSYPRQAASLLAARDRVNRAIRRLTAEK